MPIFFAFLSLPPLFIVYNFIPLAMHYNGNYRA